MTEDLRSQLADEFSVSLTGPIAALLGLDLAELVEQRITDRLPALVGELTSDDARLAAGVVEDVLRLLWPSGDVDPEWWRTSLGLVCARSLGRDESDAVTYEHAARMLGVSRGAVGQLVHRGGTFGLDRHPDGGITRASVLTRLVRLAHKRSAAPT